jgi:hypothetical protein
LAVNRVGELGRAGEGDLPAAKSTWDPFFCFCEKFVQKGAKNNRHFFMYSSMQQF